VPSSISSSNAVHVPTGLRLTASDRPGVAQPVPERDVPERPWSGIAFGALALALCLLGLWEWHWRAFGVQPGYRNSDGAWAEQRRRINSGEGNALVLIGSSRVLFDVQLPVWSSTQGEQPIQLALEGTSAVPILEDLAADPDFRGRLLIGVTPGLFFTGFAARQDAIAHHHKQGPSQRSGHWLSKNLLEPWLAFYDPDFALAAVVKRWPWPARQGVQVRGEVRKLSVQGAARNTRMWDKVVNDPAYREIIRNGWRQRLMRAPPTMDTPEKAALVIKAQIQRAVLAVARLRARGVAMVFLRAPSIDELHAAEEAGLPRSKTWDELLKRSGVPGIHFADYPALQGFDQPEWSHLSGPAADEFTARLAPLVNEALAAQKASE